MRSRVTKPLLISLFPVCSDFLLRILQSGLTLAHLTVQPILELVLDKSVPRLRQVALRPEVLLIIGSAKLERDKMINLAWAWVIARFHPYDAKTLSFNFSLTSRTDVVVKSLAQRISLVSLGSTLPGVFVGSGKSSAQATTVVKNTMAHTNKPLCR